MAISWDINKPEVVWSKRLCKVGVGVLVGILGTSSNSGGLHFYLRVCMWGT